MPELTDRIAAIYARVSTKDQSCAIQLEELRGWAARYGWTVYKEYVDEGESGRKGSRPALDRLMTDARARRFGIIVVHRLDRFGRSVLHVTQNIKLLVDQLRIRFLATSQGLDIDPDTNNYFSRLQLNMLSAFAEFECESIRERITLGLAKAKRDGTKLGRPRCVVDRVKMQELRAEGLSYAAIGRRLNVSTVTVLRRLRGPRKADAQSA